MTAEEAPAKPEPDAAPRAVPADIEARGRVWFVAAAVFLLLGPVLAAGFSISGTPMDDRTLDERGQKADAVAVGFKDVSVSSTAERYETHVTFRFKDERGRSHSTSLVVSNSRTLQAARAGDSVPLEYDPRNPELVRLVGTRIAPNGVALYVLCGLVAAFGFTLLLVAVFIRVRLWGLARHGTAVVGRVTKVDERVDNNRSLFLFDYTYTAGGETHHAMWRTRAPTVAGPIWVLHDPRHPHRSVPLV